MPLAAWHRSSGGPEESIAQSSQMVSKFRSLLFSAPQTLHLFLLSLLPNPPKLVRLNESLPLSDALLNRSSFSASIASASASGVSGMVSKLEMLGLRERRDVGVEGMDDAEETERVYVSSVGKDSLNFIADSAGDCGAEVGVLELIEVTW
jgi:hypothetical protein